MKEVRILALVRGAVSVSEIVKQVYGVSSGPGFHSCEPGGHGLHQAGAAARGEGAAGRVGGGAIVMHDLRGAYSVPDGTDRWK